MHVHTGNVKSDCFCISSLWLLIYSTVYLYLSRSVCGLLRSASLCVCVLRLPKRGGRQLAVSEAVGGVFKPRVSGGIVCEIQMLEMAPLFAYCYHCSFGAEENRLGF